MEESTFLGYCTGVLHHTERILLELVVVEEAKGLVLDDALIKLESFLFDHFLRARMAAVEHRHIVGACHLIYCIHQREEILLDVNVLLSMSREENVFALLQSKLLKDV